MKEQACMLGWIQEPSHCTPAEREALICSCTTLHHCVRCHTRFQLAQAESKKSPFTSKRCYKLPSTSKVVLCQCVPRYLDLGLNRVHPAVCFPCIEQKTWFPVCILGGHHFTKPMQSPWISWKWSFPGTITIPEEAFPKEMILLSPSGCALVPQPNNGKKFYCHTASHWRLLQILISRCQFQVIWQGQR